MVIVKKYYNNKKNKKFKWQVVNYFVPFPTGESNEEQVSGFLDVTAAEEVEGVRCAKNFTIQFSNFGSTQIQVPMQWALVYVPDGYAPNEIPLFQEAHQIYTPSQYVIMAGVYDPDNAGNTARQFTRMARNLNHGDRICFVWRFPTARDPDSHQINIKYSICYK